MQQLLASLCHGAVLGALLPLVACGDSASKAPEAVATIGPAGGSVRVAAGGLAGTALTVPAGALAVEVRMTIETGQRSNIPGVAHLGTAALIAPRLTMFATPATVTMPFDPQLLPPAATAEQIQMGFRNDVGEVSILPASAVDLAGGRVSAQTLGVGTFWAVAPDLVAAGSLLPLNNGDTYTYDNGLIVSVARTSTEPNLPPVDLAKLSFVEVGRTTGWYLREDAGSVESYGGFESGFGQEVNDSEITLLPAEVQLGQQVSSVTTYNGFRPFGSSFIDYTGIRQETTRVAEKTDVAVPAGVFPGTYRVVFTTDFRDTRPQDGTRTITMWLAPGVGPVRIQLDQGTTADLTRAVVDGTPLGD